LTTSTSMGGTSARNNPHHPTRLAWTQVPSQLFFISFHSPLEKWLDI
jgi:hypothetical protein